MINVFQQAVSPGAAPGLRLAPLGGRPAGDAIALSIIAWVRNVSYDKDVWVDVNVLEDGESVLHAEAVPLSFQEQAEGDGDFFAAGAAVPAPTAKAGSSPKLTLQFRLYGRMNGQLFTDGLLHSHQIEASPAKKPASKPSAPTSAAKPAEKATATKAATKPATPKAEIAEKAPAPKARKPKAPKA
jgi:hypothetical protein